MTAEPRISDVVGRYTLSHSMFGGGVDSEILTTAKGAYIDLMPNGSITLHRVPIVPQSHTRVFAVQEFRSSSGTFEISALGSTAKNNFYGVYLNAGKLPDPMGHPRFRRKGRSLSLSFEYFDGDFTERMVFTRTVQ